MKKLRRIWMLFASVIMTQCIMAQPEPQVTGIKADDVWNIVYKVLNDNNLAVTTSNLPGALETDFKEYSAGLFKNRAKLVFTYQNENLTITLKNRQTVSSNAWADAMIPSKKADDKLIAGFVDKIRAIATNPDEVAKLKKEGAVSTVAGTASGAPGRNSGGGQVMSRSAAKIPSRANAKEVRFDNMDNYVFTEGLCALKKNDLWGFIDTAGNVVIEFKYFSWAGFQNPKFSSGIAMVGPQNAQGTERQPIYIDKKGQQLFKTQKFTGATNFESGLAIVEKTSSTLARSFHFINKQGQDIPGSIAFSNVFGSLPKLEPFHEGLTKLYDSKTSSYGFINTQGKWVVMPSNLAEVVYFSEGLAVAQNKVNWTWGYINTKGEVKIPFDYKTKPGNFSEGLAVAQNSKEELGYIDQTGKIALPLIYDHYYVNSDFRTGCAVVYNDNAGGYAIIDKTGKIVRKLNTTVVKVLNNGWIVWKEDLGTNISQCLGVLTPDGKEILPPGYFKEIREFSNGLAYATAMIDEKEVKGFINMNFDFVIIQTY
jgi:hypothetical protein